jgi:hypothetical protein
MCKMPQAFQKFRLTIAEEVKHNVFAGSENSFKSYAVFYASVRASSFL